MAGENYTNTASVATTAAPIGPSDTTVTLANFTGFPSAPFFGEFEKGTTAAELVRITNVAGSVITMTRGQGGLSATSHGAGATFELVAPAEFYTRTETHMAATNAHGVTGNVVGTSGAQTVSDKNFRGAFRSDYTDALPVGITSSFESNANSAAARDGFVHNNTAGDASRAAFVAKQSGTDRFRVSNTGNVTINPSTGTALTVTGNASVSGNETVGGTLGVTGASTLTGGVTTSTVTASGTVSGGTLTSAGGINGLSVSVLGTVHADGNIDTDANLIVDGNLNVGVSAYMSGSTGEVGGANGVFAREITGWGAAAAIAATRAAVTSPVAGQIVWDGTVRAWYRWTGTAWFPLEPRFMGRQSGTIDRGSGVWFAVPLDTEDKDNANGHSTSSNTSRYTAVVLGSYLLSGGGGWAANASGSRGLRWSKNGVVLPQSDIIVPATPSGAIALAARTYQVDLAAGDYVELECWQNTGGTVTTQGGSVSITYLGAD